MRRRDLLLAAVSPLSALQRGVAFLAGKQQHDGSWRSETYGLLRSGHSLTPLVANALLDAEVPLADPRIGRAIAFLSRVVSPDGALGLTGDDYPVYATALTLRLFARAHHPLTPRVAAWLRTQQMSPENGWDPSHAAFGAWGIGGKRRIAPDSGHIDLSMTRHALEALAEAGTSPTDPALRHALVFVNRCQNPDGGFFFSTVETGANKAGETDAGFLSYGTATADGLISQRAAGADYQAALRWLLRRDLRELSPGFDSPARRRYAEGLRFYFADATKRALRGEADFSATLRTHQLRDGSWRNAEPLVKEDDPLISTAFAVSALSLV